MKLLPLLLLALLSTANAAEPSRTWTDSKGRTMEGVLKSKTETSASILLKSGKRADVKIADLSQADQDYIAKAEVFPQVELKAQTVKVDSNEANTKIDRRAVEVTLSEVHGRKFELAIIWLGPDGNTVGMHKAQRESITQDGKTTFKVEYKRGGTGSDYKGYTVALFDGDTIAAISSSQEPFKRFWEEDWKKKLEKR